MPAADQTSDQSRVASDAQLTKKEQRTFDLINIHLPPPLVALIMLYHSPRCWPHYNQLIKELISYKEHDESLDKYNFEHLQVNPCTGYIVYGVEHYGWDSKNHMERLHFYDPYRLASRLVLDDESKNCFKGGTTFKKRPSADGAIGIMSDIQGSAYILHNKDIVELPYDRNKNGRTWGMVVLSNNRVALQFSRGNLLFIKDNQQVHCLNSNAKNTERSCLYSINDSLIASKISIGDSTNLEIIDYDSQQIAHTLKFDSSTYLLDVTPVTDNHFAILSSHDESKGELTRLTLWDNKTFTKTKELCLAKTRLPLENFASDNHGQFAVSNPEENNIRIFHFNPKGEITSIADIPLKSPKDLAFSPHGDQLVTHGRSRVDRKCYSRERGSYIDKQAKHSLYQINLSLAKKRTLLSQKKELDPALIREFYPTVSLSNPLSKGVGLSMMQKHLPIPKISEELHINKTWSNAARVRNFAVENPSKELCKRR
jgi:hypothetical protein